MKPSLPSKLVFLGFKPTLGRPTWSLNHSKEPQLLSAILEWAVDMEVQVQKLRKSDFDYGKKEEGDGESGEEQWEEDD